jgi:hypothetical protein
MAPEDMTSKKADSVIIGDDSDRERRDLQIEADLDTNRRSLPTDYRPHNRDSSRPTNSQSRPRRTTSSSSHPKRSSFSKPSANFQDIVPLPAEASRPTATSYASSIASSRRASSTYDGSRRPRHVRSQMSVMTPEQIEQALDLHQRSCSIFRTTTSMAPTPTISRSPSLQNQLPQQSRPRPPQASTLQRSTTDSVVPHRSLQRNASSVYQPTLGVPRRVAHQAEEQEDENEEEEACKPDYLPATIIHWTSPSTRRREYEELDRQSRGLRRFWRKIKPRCWGGDSMVQLYDGTTGADNGSIRRYRIDDEDDHASHSDAGSQYDEMEKEAQLPNRRWISRFRR